MQQVGQQAWPAVAEVRVSSPFVGNYRPCYREAIVYHRPNSFLWRNKNLRYPVYKVFPDLDNHESLGFKIPLLLTSCHHTRGSPVKYKGYIGGGGFRPGIWILALRLNIRSLNQSNLCIWTNVMHWINCIWFDLSIILNLYWFWH